MCASEYDIEANDTEGHLGQMSSWATVYHSLAVPQGASDSVLPLIGAECTAGQILCDKTTGGPQGTPSFSDFQLQRTACHFVCSLSFLSLFSVSNSLSPPLCTTFSIPYFSRFPFCLISQQMVPSQGWIRSLRVRTKIERRGAGRVRKKKKKKQGEMLRRWCKDVDFGQSCAKRL